MQRTLINKKVAEIISAYDPDAPSKKIEIKRSAQDIPKNFKKMCRSLGAPIKLQPAKIGGAQGCMYTSKKTGRHEIRLDKFFGNNMRTASHELSHFFDYQNTRKEWNEFRRVDDTPEDYVLAPAHTKSEFVAENSSKIIADVYGFIHESPRDICNFLKSMYQNGMYGHSGLMLAYGDKSELKVPTLKDMQEMSQLVMQRVYDAIAMYEAALCKAGFLQVEKM